MRVRGGERCSGGGGTRRRPAGGAGRWSPSASSTVSTVDTSDHRAHREAGPGARRAVGGGHLRPAPVRGGAARLAPGRADRAGPQGGADRGARRRRALRACRSRSDVLAPVGRGVRARRAGRAPARGGGRGRGELPVRAQGGRRRARCWTGSGRTFGFTVEGAPLVARRRRAVFSSTYIRSLRGRRRRGGRGRGARPAAPARGRGGARRPARARARLPDREPADAPRRGGAGRRRLRGLAGPARRRGDREPLQSAAVSIGTNPTFSGRERRVEAYVLDFDGDLYGERLALDFVAHLREQRTLRRRSSRWSTQIARGRRARPGRARLISSDASACDASIPDC